MQVVNDGSYDEYVRVKVRRSWTDADGSKNTVLDPELIELGISSGWVEDTTDNTAEGDVYYYTSPLAIGGLAQFIETITINNEVLTYVKTVDGDETGTVVNEYKYDGKSFYVEIDVDAVQAHNASDAILGAWGIDATVDDAGTITSINGKTVN